MTSTHWPRFSVQFWVASQIRAVCALPQNETLGLGLKRSALRSAFLKKGQLKNQRASITAFGEFDVVVVWVL